MNTHKNVRFSGDLSVHEDEMRFAVKIAPVLNSPEFSETRPELPFGFSLDKLLRLGAIPDQLRYRNHLQPVLPAEVGEFRNAGHCAIRVHDFADHAARIQAGEACQVDSRFRLS